MHPVSLVLMRQDVGVDSVSVSEKKYYSYVQILAGHENVVGKKL
jgi:hypothetical protein